MSNSNNSAIYMDDLPVLTPAELQNLVEVMYGDTDRQAPRPLLVLGPPGVGKTEILSTCKPFEGRPWRTFYAGYADRTDISGYPVPVPEENVVRVMPTDVILGSLHDHVATKPPVLFFDEVTNAPRDVQSVLLEVTRRHSVNGRPLPDGTALLMAGNLHTHNAGSHRLITSLDDRTVRVQLRPDVDDWCRHVLASVSQSDNAMDTVALMRMHPELLHDWSPTAQTTATPRGWVDTITTLDMLDTRCGGEAPDVMRRAAAAGIVGLGRAVQLMAIREVRGRLPAVTDILMDPQGAPMVESSDPALLYSLVSLLAGRLVRTRSADEFDRAFTYMTRYDVMYPALFVSMVASSLQSESSKVCVGEAYTRWLVQHSGLLFS